MSTDSLFNISASGIQQGLARLDRTVEEIAAPAAVNNSAPHPSPADDTARQMVDLIAAEQQVDANAKSLETANETIGRLLDVRA